MKAIRIIAVAVAPLLAAGTVRGQATLPPILRSVGYDQRVNEQIPLDLVFHDEADRKVRLDDYFHDKPVVLVLVQYRCPRLCTEVLNGLVRSMLDLSLTAGKDFEVVTVSFDPREGPVLAAAKKKAYMARYKRSQAEKGWHFLTGSKEATEALTKAVGFRYAWDEATKQWAHPAGVVVVTPEGRISHYLFGVEYSPKDLRLALVDSAGGRIGNPIDHALLYCYTYDPKTGSYSASILNLVRLGAVATLFALGGFILTTTMRRRPRASRPAGRGTNDPS